VSSTVFACALTREEAVRASGALDSRVRFPPPPLFDCKFRRSSIFNRRRLRKHRHFVMRVESGPADRNNRQDIPWAHRQKFPSSATCQTLSRYCSGCRSRAFLNCIISYDDRVAAKWGHCLGREARAQDAETFRCKCKGHEQEYCCTFHVLGSYQKQSGDGKLILQNSAAAGGQLPSHYHIMVQASTEVVRQPRSRPMTTRRWRRTKMADSGRIGSARHPRSRWQK